MLTTVTDNLLTFEQISEEITSHSSLPGQRSAESI